MSNGPSLIFIEPVNTDTVKGVLHEMKKNEAAFDPARNWAIKLVAQPDPNTLQGARFLINEDVYMGYVPTAKQLVNGWAKIISSAGEMMAVASSMLEKDAERMAPYVMTFLNGVHQSPRYCKNNRNKNATAKVFLAVGTRLLETKEPVKAFGFLWRAFTIAFRHKDKLNGRAMLNCTTERVREALGLVRALDPAQGAQFEQQIAVWTVRVKDHVPSFHPTTAPSI